MGGNKVSQAHTVLVRELKNVMCTFKQAENTECDLVRETKLPTKQAETVLKANT